MPPTRCARVPVDQLLASVEVALRKAAHRWARVYRLDFDDLLQDARLIVVSHASEFDPDRSTPQRWALSWAAGALRDRRRQRLALERAVERRFAEVLVQGEARESAAVEENEARAAVAAALAELPANQARLVRLVYGIGCLAVPSVQELARREKCHHSTVNRQLAQAFDALRALLKS